MVVTQINCSLIISGSPTKGERSAARILASIINLSKGQNNDVTTHSINTNQTSQNINTPSPSDHSTAINAIQSHNAGRENVNDDTHRNQPIGKNSSAIFLESNHSNENDIQDHEADSYKIGNISGLFLHRGSQWASSLLVRLDEDSDDTLACLRDQLNSVNRHFRETLLAGELRVVQGERGSAAPEGGSSPVISGVGKDSTGTAQTDSANRSPVKDLNTETAEVPDEASMVDVTPLLENAAPPVEKDDLEADAEGTQST